MTSYARDQVLDRTVYDIDVLRGAERRDLAKERLAEGRTIPQMEAELDLPGGETKLVIVAGQPIEMGDEPCLLFTFADLEPRRRAQDALRHSEERFTRTFQMAPVPMAIGARDGHLLCKVNASFPQMTGYSPDEIIGRPLGEVGLWENAAVRRRVEAAINAGEDLRDEEVRIHAKDGAILDCIVSTEAIRLGDGACILWAMQDITQRKATEVELVEAIEAVMKDTSWFSRSVIDKLARLRTPQGEKAGPGAERPDAARTRRACADLSGAGRQDDRTDAGCVGQYRAQPCRPHLCEDRRQSPDRGGGMGAQPWFRRRDPAGNRRSGGSGMSDDAPSDRKDAADKPSVRAAKGSVHEAIGKLIGDDAARDRGSAEKAAGEAAGKDKSSRS